MRTAIVTTFRRLRQFARASDGVGSITSVFMMVVTLMVAGLALDYASAVRTSARLQTVADASALAAAMRLPDTVGAINEALSVATLNGNNGAEGKMVQPADIEIGVWNFERSRFDAGQAGANAVRVTSRRSSASGNAMRTLLLGLVGMDSFDLIASSVALRQNVVRCSGGGYFSAQRTTVSNTNHFFNGFCLHGERGVTLRNSSYFEPGTTISMPDLRNFSASNGNVGAVDALREYGHTFLYLDTIRPTIAALRSGDISSSGLPSYITGAPILLSRITSSTTLQRNRLYIVNGTVELGSNKDLSDIAIVATGEIRLSSNLRLDRMILATDSNVVIGSNNRIGRHELDFCATGVYSTYILAAGNIAYNSNNEVRDVLMASLGTVDMGNNNLATDGVLTEALGAITIGNADRARVCRNGLQVEVGPMKPTGPGGSVLVQ
jgi:hypothetical protein